MSPDSPLERSAALWNRRDLDLRSDEILSQVLDRGSLADWRELYRLAAKDRSLRQRILRLCRTAPLPFPHLFISAMAYLGEVQDRYPDVADRDEIPGGV